MNAPSANPWTDTDMCRRGTVCSLCRNKGDAGQLFRSQWIEAQFPGTGADFDCPFGKAWNSEDKTPVARRPFPTASQAAFALQAVLTAAKVPDDVAAARQAICAACSYSRLTPAGVRWCGICGCGVDLHEKTILTLSLYGENLPK